MKPPSDETNSAWFWLWAEIARRFGQEDADRLRADYTTMQQQYLRDTRRVQYAEEIPKIEERLKQAREHGQSDVYIRRQERMLARRKQYLEHGGEDADEPD